MCVQGSNSSLRTSDIEGAKPFSWADTWDKLGNKALRTTNYIGDIDGAQPGGLRKRPGADREVQLQEGEEINLLGTWRQSNPLAPHYTRLDGTRPASRDHYRDPTVPAFPFGAVKEQVPKPSRLPPMQGGDVFPKLLPPPPEPLQTKDLDAKAAKRQEKRVLDQVRDKVEAKSKHMGKVFRQFDENKDGDISYDEFRLGLRHLGIELSDGDFGVLVKKVDVDGEGSVDYNEFAEVLKAPDMQLSFMPTDAPFAGTADTSSMKTDLKVKRAGAFDGSKRKQMGMAMLPKDDILRQIAEKVESKSKNMRNVFRAFDEDKSGTVDMVEFRRGLAHLGFEMTDDKFEKLLQRVDRNGDGDINYNEFAARLKGQDQQIGGIGGVGVSDWEAEGNRLAEELAAQQSTNMGFGGGSKESKLIADISAKVEGKSKYIRKVFRDFDEDSDGTVNHAEFRRGLNHMGINLKDDEFNMVLDMVDKDRDGTVDYMEFANVLKGQDMALGMNQWSEDQPGGNRPGAARAAEAAPQAAAAPTTATAAPAAAAPVATASESAPAAVSTPAPAPAPTPAAAAKTKGPPKLPPKLAGETSVRRGSNASEASIRASALSASRVLLLCASRSCVIIDVVIVARARVGVGAFGVHHDRAHRCGEQERDEGSA